MAHEWLHGGGVDALAPLIERGRIKLYCVESNVADCWTHATDHPHWRLKRHQAYERFVMDELVPFIREDCRSPNIDLVAAGASLGGWYAVNTALKHPETFRWALSLSGRFSMERMLDGWWGDDLYYELPFVYAPNLGGEALERVRRNTSVTLVVGRGAFEGSCLPETLALSEVLRRKGIPVERDVWGTDVSHEWHWWQRQAAYHFGRRFG
jgi:esterase/lipase superfamily enzyme